MAETTMPPPALREASAETLLAAFASLTHEIHYREHAGRLAADKREERDLVKVEILRRMGEI